MVFRNQTELADKKPVRGLQFRRRYWLVVVSILLISLVIHLVSVLSLDAFQSRHSNLGVPKQAPVKFRIVGNQQTLPKSKRPPPPEPESSPAQRLLETPQTKTERPEHADYAGVVNHQTDKQTRVSEKVKRERAADAGPKGKPKVTAARQQGPEQPLTQRPQTAIKPKPLNSPTTEVKSKFGSLAIDQEKHRPRNAYEALLPTGATDLPGQLNAGYQDFVDEKITEGDRIDINTSEYRYIGYFTSMRKAIELVWNYPLDAARKGEQGEVGLEFIIAQDGKVTHIRVLHSSGYGILDDAIIQAIRLASPFSPLPPGIGKNRLVVTGSFRYILNGI